MITPLTRIRKSDHQVSCDLNGEVALLNLTTAQYFGLDQVGAHVWQALDGTKRVSDLVAAVLDAYDVEEERCTADLIALVGKLANAGLVDVMPEK